MSQQWQTSDGTYAYSSSVNTRPAASHPGYATHPARRGESVPVQKASEEAHPQASQQPDGQSSQQQYGQPDQPLYAGLRYSPPDKLPQTSKGDEEMYTHLRNPSPDVYDKRNKEPRYSPYEVTTSYGERELRTRAINGRSEAQEYAKERERQRLAGERMEPRKSFSEQWKEWADGTLHPFEHGS